MVHDSILRIHAYLLKHKLLLLLIALLSLMIVLPFMDERHANYIITMEFFITAILIFGIYVVSTNKQLLTVAILIALLIFTVIWFNIFLQEKDLLVFSLLLEILFFIITAVTILAYVLDYHKVTADKLYGAVCVYLFIGIMWALLYLVIETVSPGSFAMTNGSKFPGTYAHPAYFSQFMYYSFVTMTTLGYGDIVPLTNPARAFATLEAVVGQLFVVVLIARLVGLHITHSIRK